MMRPNPTYMTRWGDDKVNKVDWVEEGEEDV
jgi:hypothetical protein